MAHTNFSRCCRHWYIFWIIWVTHTKYLMLLCRWWILSTSCVTVWRQEYTSTKTLLLLRLNKVFFLYKGTSFSCFIAKNLCDFYVWLSPYRSLVARFSPKIGLDTEAERYMQANVSVLNITCTCIWKVEDFLCVPRFSCIVISRETW